MRNVVLTRVDERLIHGQVMTSWLKLCNANVILIIDAGSASNAFLNRVAEDQADDKTANERTVDRCPLAHGTKRPADVREAIEQRDQANLQDTDIHKFSLLISILGFTAKAVPPLGSELRERGSGVGPAVYFNSFLTSSFASDGTIWQ